MTNRICVAVVASLMAAAFAVLPSGSAEAARACVSVREFNHMHTGTRTHLENEWGVRGHADRVSRHDAMPLGFRQNVRPDSKVLKYELCGYGPKRGAVYVYFSNADGRWYFSSYWRVGQSPMVPSV